MPEFKKEPICEECHKNLASYFLGNQEMGGNRWKFSCKECEPHPLEYSIEIDDFFKSPTKTIDWLAHLSEKNWIDWTDFMNMIHRFRAGTGSFFA